jgi:hypothetical protein
MDSELSWFVGSKESRVEPLGCYCNVGSLADCPESMLTKLFRRGYHDGQIKPGKSRRQRKAKIVT